MSSAEIFIKNEFNKHYQNLCYYAYTLIGDKVLAEDFVQEAFLSLYNKHDSIISNDNVYKSFLYTSVKNSILNWHRHSKVEDRYHQLTPLVDYIDLDLDNALLKTEVIEEVNRLIDQLPASCKRIFKLYYLDGLSTKEISTQLDVSINTVKTQKSRGLKYIQSKLHPEYFIAFLLIIK